MVIKRNGFLLEIENLLLIILISFFISGKIKLFLTSYFVCYLFIIFHELSHIIFATIYGKKIKRIKLSLAGICVTFNNESIDIVKKIIIYIAGPMSNFALALIFKKIDFVFEINLFLGVLNLLPIYPLDGYNIIIVLLDFVGKSSYIVFIEGLFLLILLFISFFVFVTYFNPSLLIFICYIILIKYAYKNQGKIR